MDIKFFFFMDIKFYFIGLIPKFNKFLYPKKNLNPIIGYNFKYFGYKILCNGYNIKMYLF